MSQTEVLETTEPRTSEGLRVVDTNLRWKDTTRDLILFGVHL
jgi:hypothetical protein